MLVRAPIPPLPADEELPPPVVARPGRIPERPPAAVPAPRVGRDDHDAATAGAAALDRLDGILAALREQSGLLDAQRRELRAARKSLDQLAAARLADTAAPGPADRLLSLVRRGWRLARQAAAGTRGTLARRDDPARAPVAAAPPDAAPPEIEWILAGSPGGKDRRTLLILALGMADAELARFVAQAKAAAADAPVVPVFLVDRGDFALLRHAGVLFEYLPPIAQRRLREPERDWDLYAARRFSFLCRKWQPLRLLAAGPASAACVAALRGNAAVEDDLRALLDGQEQPIDPAGAGAGGHAAPPAA